MPELSFQEILRRVGILRSAIDAVEIFFQSEEIDDTAYRLKTFQFYSEQKMVEVYNKLASTLELIDSPRTRREDIPIIVRDTLRWAGLGTEIPPNQPIARNVLKKAVKAAEATLEYYRTNPNKPFDIEKVTTILALNIIHPRNKQKE